GAEVRYGPYSVQAVSDRTPAEGDTSLSEESTELRERGRLAPEWHPDFIVRRSFVRQRRRAVAAPHGAHRERIAERGRIARFQATSGCRCKENCSLQHQDEIPGVDDATTLESRGSVWPSP